MTFVHYIYMLDKLIILHTIKVSYFRLLTWLSQLSLWLCSIYKYAGWVCYIRPGWLGLQRIHRVNQNASIITVLAICSLRQWVTHCCYCERSIRVDRSVRVLWFLLTLSTNTIANRHTYNTKYQYCHTHTTAVRLHLL